MRIGIFGGSFDPVHNGHIQLVQAFINELSLDRALIVPAFVSPFKQGNKPAMPFHRLEMCKLAFKSISRTQICDIELKRKGASYTYMTLEELKKKYKNDNLFLITGADSFLSIHTWKNPDSIFKNAVICGVPRADDDIDVLKKQAEYLHTLGAETEILDVNVMTVSSTQIRRLSAEGKSIKGLVPEEVENYILQNKLYQKG